VTQTAAPLADRARRAALWSCLGAGFATLFDATTVAYTAPALAETFDASAAGIQWFLASFSLTFGLGLVPSGKGGAALISFTAQWTGRMPVGGPKEILVFAAPPANVDPNLLRTAGLVLVADMKFPRQAVFDWTQRLAVDQPGPGGQPTTGIAKINPAELARLGRATTLHASIFAIDVEFKTSQRQALRDFAERIASR